MNAETQKPTSIKVKILRALPTVLAAVFVSSSLAIVNGQVIKPRPTPRPIQIPIGRPTAKPPARPTPKPTPKPAPGETGNTRNWKAGDRILARWADSYWYPAKIVRKSGSKYTILYDFDKIETQIDPKYIHEDSITMNTEVESKKQKAGKYYPGRVQFRRGDSLQIAYDDGDIDQSSLSRIRLAFKDLPAPREDYSLRVCNDENEKVYFTITYATLSNFATEGWWWVSPKNCYQFDLTARMEASGVPGNFRKQIPVFIYGETEGIFGGAVKKVFEGDDPSKVFCIDDDRSKSFRNFKWREAGDQLLPNTCSGSGQELVKMSNMEYPKRGKLFVWRF